MVGGEVLRVEREMRKGAYDRSLGDRHIMIFSIRLERLRPPVAGERTGERSVGVTATYIVIKKPKGRGRDTPSPASYHVDAHVSSVPRSTPIHDSAA
jgi:hypothetical protein